MNPRGKLRGLAREPLAAIALTVSSAVAYGQRSSEDAVAEALDAFGSTVGREAIGLYSADSARGFSPTQAGNLRINGLYFDQVRYFSNLVSRIVRGSSVHVGISAQGYLMPAPTGVVDYQLRTPGNEFVASVLIGDATYGVAYNETDVQIPIVRDALSIGAGIGYTRNQLYGSAMQGQDWTAGWIARWQASDSLTVIPFWSIRNHREFGEKPNIVIDTSGFPRFHMADPMGERWADLGGWGSNFGAVADFSFAPSWSIRAGLFRSLERVVSDFTFLNNTNSLNQGDYSVTAIPPSSNGSTSGEIRLSKQLNTASTRNTLYVRVTGRDSSLESGAGDTRNFGPASITDIPQFPEPSFNRGANSDVKAREVTPGVAYAGLWPDVGQVTLGMQKVFYHRTVAVPNMSPASDQSSPWLYSAAAAAFPSRKLAVYSSYTRGFEEIGTAPLNAANRNEPVPAQVTNQVDAGLRYQLLPKLQLVTGVFEINKPYFNLDQLNVFRIVGHTSNRGVEFSLTGDITDRLNVVSGVVLIDPRVHYQGGISGSTNAVAIGPIPGFMSTYLQYRPEAAPGLILGVTVQTTSSRYAVYPNVNLPNVTTVGVDARYQTKLIGKDATFWLQAYNLADSYELTPSASGLLTALDARRFELSLVVDF